MKPSKEFEKSGIWWLPENPDDAVSGIIKYSKDDWFILTLTGSKESWISINEDKNFQLIHGQTSGGEHYSLYDCQFGGSTWGGSGLMEIKIVSYTIFKGFLIPSLTQKNIKNLSCGFTHLNLWASTTGLKVKKRKGINFDIIYRHPKDIVLFKNQEMTIKLTHFSSTVPWHTPEDGKIDLNEIASIVVKPKKPFEFKRYKKILRNLQDFFTIIFLRLSTPENIFAEGNFDPQILNDSEKLFPHAEVFYYLSYKDRARSYTNAIEFLFKYDDVVDEIQSILGNWLSKSQKLETTRNLYAGSLYLEFTLEAQFLLLCQSFESYHRNFYDAYYTTTEKYDEIKKQLIEAIPQNLDSNFKSSLINRINYLNEYSLAKRLKTVLKNQKEIFETHLTKTDLLIKDIVDHRNFLTHRPVDSPIIQIDYEKLFYLINTMKFIIEVCFLKEMGFENSKIKDFVGNNMVYKSRFNLNIY